MLKIAVVEDQQEVRDELCRFIRKYAAENSLQVEAVPIEDWAVIAAHYEPGWDIIFMDVEMPGLDGFGAAEKIRAVDGDAVLVFVTNMAQYAIKGYEVDALDYVLKPVNYYQFCTKLSRAVQRVERRRGGQVVCSWQAAECRCSPPTTSIISRPMTGCSGITLQKGSFRSGPASPAPKSSWHSTISPAATSAIWSTCNTSRPWRTTSSTSTPTAEISRRQRAAFLTAVASYIGGVL